ncbi:MAG TPA: hypothetical protein VGI40_11930 [Pirellulaceae bacterium]|jgi:Leucine-rich repeat (LRR) protein
MPTSRWRRFSLRALLLLVTLAAIFLGWFAWRLKTARIQDASAEAIVQAGGQVAYSNQFDGHVSRLTPYQPKTNFLGTWSQKLVGGDPTRKMVSVTLMDDDSAAAITKYNLRDLKIVRFSGGASITDAAVAHLANCPELQVLYLERANITDRALESIGRHKKLEELWLANTPVTDAILPGLRELPALRVLDIRGTAISNEGMKQVAALPAVWLLYLDSDRVTDEGIRQLHASQSIHSVWLGEQSSANLDLANIAAIPNLEALTLTGSLITDDHVAALKGNPKIKDLKFQSCTRLTDASLDIAATLPNLRSLGTQRTPFTAPALQQFKFQRPNCTVR